MHRVLIAALLAAGSTAYGDPPGLTPTTPADDPPDIDPQVAAFGRDTSRVMFGAAAINFLSYPEGIEDAGPSFVIGKPLWLGERKAHFQWVLDATLIAGYGTQSHHAQFAALPGFGFNMYWGRRVGAEVRGELAGFAQLGRRTAAGAGAGWSGAFVIRPLPDDRQRIKLWATMNLGFSFAEDSMNDSFGAGAMGAGIAYETPY